MIQRAKTLLRRKYRAVGRFYSERRIYACEGGGRSTKPDAMRVLLLTLALSAGYAPMQCRGEPEYEERRYEQPGEALYRLANQFKKSGKVDAWRTTLEHLIEHYPNSRFATMAKDDLAKAGSTEEGVHRSSADKGSANSVDKSAASSASSADEDTTDEDGESK